MIVNYTESGWQIITQRSHGLLAAQICAQWKKDNQPVRWVETLIATAEHDDVYNEFENENLLNENGGPVNFKMTEFSLDDGQRLIDMAKTKSAYIALLISRHIQFVHGEDPKAKSFIAELKKLEANWRKAADISQKEVNAGYELLEFCDAFSLLICQGLIQPEDRGIEISNGPDGKAYHTHTIGDQLTVEPWPFEIPFFEVIYESRTLAELSFKNVAAFRKAIDEAETVRHVLKFKR
jgi:hypothetical protein